ncbi:insulin-like peptide receptor isoform X2 [Acanthaster planci]|uniref:Tyrosine-protein kinase receptor n=1 Tax=Acanthaster planci TaxID=133434 RepID=A0A8B8A4S3_ACAPL|nr:insulin-like peptide receptor isoform X2 [Acanthaster planci]
MLGVVSRAVPACCTLAAMLLVLSTVNCSKGAEEICGSMDIRNKVDNFKELENCSVIEGDLHILLIEEASPGDYDHLSFPKLREITGFFVLYRVSHLLTLRHLFPNLAVIRGDTLFYNYALVVYEMLEMQEIGLTGLVTILRGAIRLEKNPNLCYMDTIDWSLILREGTDNNFIVDNKDQGGCLNFCPKSGGRNTCRMPTALGTVRELCWSSEHCQKVCPPTCLSACNGMRCCHDSCVGGCSGPTNRDCIACRKLAYNGECINTCPAYTYEYKTHRCIHAAQCPQHWKLHNGQCIEECPTSFITNITNARYCQPCDGPCPKVCEGRMVVNSVGDAANLAGCTIINGSLEIGIRSGTNIMKELEKNLGMIEEVTEKIVIRMAHSLVSLNFLKHLKRIGGTVLENGLYSFYLLDNRNLQQLFDVQNYPNITISNGSLFFHNNPKLCVSNITTFESRANFLTQPKNNNFGTNGDQVACSMHKIRISVKPMASTLMIRWGFDVSKISDKRNLLGFIVSYRKAPFKNVTIFDGEDACGTSQWETIYENPGEPFTLLVGLEPWTQYAIFVRSYMIANTGEGAQSDIKYVSTKEKEPGPPSDLVVLANSSNQLVVSWGPPKKPNSLVVEYRVRWQKQELAVSQFSSRDFCREKPPTLVSEVIVKPEEQDTEGNQTCQEGCCPCPKDKETLKLEEEEALFQKQFENFLHNHVFIQRPDAKRRRKREAPEDSPAGTPPSAFTTLSPGSFRVGNSTSPSPVPGLGTSPAPTPLVFMEQFVTNTTFVLEGLDHFTEYMVEVQACNKVTCGLKMATFGRTLPKRDADAVPPSLTANVTSKDPQNRRVKLSWEEPPSPNGIIILHEIVYNKIEAQDREAPPSGSGDQTGSEKNREDVVGKEATPTPENKPKGVEICVSAARFRQQGGYEFAGLEPGNYSARVRVFSLAGEGVWTDPLMFTVPEPVRVPTAVPNSGLGAMGITIGSCVTVVIILVVAIWCLIRWRYKKNQMPDGVLYASVNPEYMSTSDMYVADEWEFPRNQLDIICELGKGSFGMVYEGRAKKILPDEDVTTVAVKSVQANASIRDRIEFLNEASVMKAIHTHHVVKLLGVVSKGQPTFVIMEYMAQGDLKNWLRARRPENQTDVPLQNRKYPPSLPEILNMGVEVADGMAYLTAHKYVHRDLSARNCLVSADNTCKVADFGLARDIYQSDYYRKEKGGMLPIRWMAPESIRDGVFTSSSDVWSFGVLMWEIATLSELPYQGMSNEEAGEYVKNGSVLNKPECCPDKLDEIMVMCWQYNEKLRPTFLEIIQLFENTGTVLPRFAQNSFYHSEERQHQQQDSHDKLDEEELERVSILGDSEKDIYENMAPKERKRIPKNGLVPANGRAVHNGSNDSSIGKVTQC